MSLSVAGSTFCDWTMSQNNVPKFACSSFVIVTYFSDIVLFCDVGLF